MAIQTTTIQLKFRDTLPRSLRYGQIQAGSVSVAGLAANQYEVGRVGADGSLITGGAITAIRALTPRGEALYTVTLQYDDTRPVVVNPYAAVVTALETARTALGEARAALQTSVPALNSEDATIQALGAPNVAQLTTRVKALSARNKAVAADVVNALQAQVEADQAIADALAALKTRG